MSHRSKRCTLANNNRDLGPPPATPQVLQVFCTPKTTAHGSITEVSAALSRCGSPHAAQLYEQSHGYAATSFAHLRRGPPPLPGPPTQGPRNGGYDYLECSRYTFSFGHCKFNSGRFKYGKHCGSFCGCNGITECKCSHSDNSQRSYHESLDHRWAYEYAHTHISHQEIITGTRKHALTHTTRDGDITSGHGPRRRSDRQ